MRDRVIEAIDNAIEDWEVSGDAMRWVPSSSDRPERPTAGEVYAAGSTAAAAAVRGFANAFLPAMAAMSRAFESAAQELRQLSPLLAPAYGHDRLIRRRALEAQQARHAHAFWTVRPERSRPSRGAPTGRGPYRGGFS